MLVCLRVPPACTLHPNACTAVLLRRPGGIAWTGEQAVAWVNPAVVAADRGPEAALASSEQTQRRKKRLAITCGEDEDAGTPSAC